MGSSVTVDKDNVLKIAKLFHDEGIRIRDQVTHQLTLLAFEQMLGDGISEAAAAIATWKTSAPDNESSFSARAQQYSDTLVRAAESLKETAASYGYTENEIAAAMAGPDQVSPTPPHRSGRIGAS